MNWLDYIGIGCGIACMILSLVMLGLTVLIIIGALFDKLPPPPPINTDNHDDWWTNFPWGGI